MTPEYVLNEISHNNLLMYAAAIPPLDTDSSEDKASDRLDGLDWGGKLDMDNPDNFTDTDDQRQRI